MSDALLLFKSNICNYYLFYYLIIQSYYLLSTHISIDINLIAIYLNKYATNVYKFKYVD